MRFDWLRCFEIMSEHYLEVHAGEYRGLQVAIKTLLTEKQNAHSISSFTREAAVMS